MTDSRERALPAARPAPTACPHCGSLDSSTLAEMAALRIALRDLMRADDLYETYGQTGTGYSDHDYWQDVLDARKAAKEALGD